MDSGQCGRGAAPESEIGAAAHHRLKRGGVVWKGADPFHLDVLCGKGFFQLSALFGNEGQAAPSPAKTHGIGGADKGRSTPSGMRTVRQHGRGQASWPRIRLCGTMFKTDYPA